MSDLLQALEFLQPFVFGGLWAVALYQWGRRPGAATTCLVLTFGAFGLPLVAAAFLPDDPRGALFWVVKVLLTVLVLFPYFLYRFTATFGIQNRAMDVSALALTGAAIALVVPLPEIPPGEVPPVAMGLVIVLLVQWTLLSAVVAVRLWRWGHDQPTVARLRMRTMSLGAAGLALALIIAGSVNPGGEPPVGLSVLSELLSMATAPMFLLGFAPPGFVRTLWRKGEEEALNEAHVHLMEATSPREVAEALLPSAASLMGGGGAVLVDGGRNVVGAHGLSPAEATQLAERSVTSNADAPDATPAPILSVPLRSGFLAVQATPFTPFFGRDETELLNRLALLADLALDRAAALQREVTAREQLEEAQRITRIGSWEWDVRADKIRWSDELYRIVEMDPKDFAASYEGFMERVHEDDHQLVRRVVERALTERQPFDIEHRFVTPSGEIRTMQARGTVIVDDDGNVVRLIGTSQDITERKQQEIFRDQFIANAAHEMRTPLTTLMGFVEVLAHQGEGLTEDQRGRAFEALSRSGDRMSRLVSNLLDLTKLKQGRAEVHLEAIDVSGLVTDVLETTPPPEGVEVKYSLADRAAALADRHLLEQILVNLLTNAYRYGGSDISIETGSLDDAVVTSISDDGPGVPETLRETLFEPFARGDAALGAGGSGLGLAIVKTLTEACGGDIWYEPRHPQGATFRLRLRTAK